MAFARSLLTGVAYPDMLMEFLTPILKREI
jgi:hypothetical protein